MAVIENFYPPIIETYMPAFVISGSNDSCRVYFAISKFTDVEDIANVQVTIRSQATNLSVLNPTRYPSEVMLTDLEIDNNIMTDAKYYIEITSADMVDGTFVVDQYYKVQLRFTSTEATNIPSTSSYPQSIDSWLTTNLLYFSEWSTVCLIRGISTPTVSLQTFTPGSAVSIAASIANTPVVGTLNFADPNETETLKSYRIVLFEGDDILEDSGEIFTSDYTNPNTINYTLHYDFQPSHQYYFTLQYTTSNLYHTILNPCTINATGSGDPIEVQITTTLDEDNGRIKINLAWTKPSGGSNYTGKILIRRADVKSNFTIWDTLQTFIYNGVSSIDTNWYDYTIESGVFYKYAIQGVTSEGVISTMRMIDNPIMLVLNDMFLTVGDKQLKLRFNPQISSFKETISENKIDTIGSQFPFIKRNGAVDYIQFPISTLISSYMDEDELFTSKDEIYGTNKGLYVTYNSDNDISAYKDFVYEQRFRDEVRKFLYEDSVKLFRSPTEGNILVRLMDIQFQPNQTLGRCLYSVSGTAYQIDLSTIENYQKYKVLINEE